jgi:hypothetical protein
MILSGETGEGSANNYAGSMADDFIVLRPLFLISRLVLDRKRALSRR